MESLSSGLTLTADQYFLLYYIIGMYFAPDLEGERLRKSVLQRRSEGLPPYTSNQLAGTYTSIVEVERVYCYVLREANDSLIVKPPLLQQIFHGNLPISVEDPTLVYPSFNDLFPPKLHPRTLSGNQFAIVHNIVFINDPDISYIRPGDIARLKRLTGLKSFHLDRAGAMLHSFVDGETLHDVTVQEETKSENHLHHGSVQQFGIVPYTGNGRPVEGNLPSSGTLPFDGHFPCGNTQMYDVTVPSPTKTSSEDQVEARRIFLPSCPSREVWSNIVAATKSGFSVTGTAAKAKVGPILGLIDVGESDDSYLFRVSLPGVKRDEREFSCEVEKDGKVLIQGVTTTGEKIVHKTSQVFEMQSLNLCPSGHFSISFKLPGLVDPHQFSGNFGTDGILEGIVMKVGQI